VTDRQEPRLSVGVISAGAVGTAVAEVLRDAGHLIHGVVAPSEAARARVAERLSGVPVIPLAEAAQAALVVLAVPDPVLPRVAAQVAEVTRPGQIVVHTAGSVGCGVLQPVTDTGALPLALHPAMTFTGQPVDAERLLGCAWGVTSDSETGAAVAELLVGSVGGVPVQVPEEGRTLYHAAMAHGANHVVTLVSEAQRMLDHALAADAETGGGGEVRPAGDAGVLLRRIVPAAVGNALTDRMGALTGPTARDDAPTVLRHLAALGQLPEPQLAAGYREDAERTARAAGSIDVERALRPDYPDHPSEDDR
jgi:predicted short-subunit dehydrogenase-like oxidoreductase (DUF2520 family)